MEKKIYLVGGAVRDKLLNIVSNDKDYVAIGYTKEEFSHLECVGKDFPVFLLEDGNELALARREKKTSNGYNGFSVDTQGVSLEEDLSRRDLTINSIAYDEENDIIIDPFEGQKDIQNKILRHTTKAFKEDPLRVLRLARFYARFGSEWIIADETKKLVKSMKEELQYLQKERVYKEIDRVLEYKEWYLFFAILKELEVLTIVFPIVAKSFILEKCQIVTSRLSKLVLVYQDSLKTIDDFDVEFCKKEKQNIVLLIQRVEDVKKFDQLNDTQKVFFFTSFRKNNALFFEFLYLSNLLNISIKTSFFVNVFESINTYSPKDWIDQQNKQIKPQDMQQHIFDVNLEYIKGN